MSAFRIEYRRRGARKWLTDPRRRFSTQRATAEADLEGTDHEKWETRIVEILQEDEPDYQARLQLKGRWEPSPWPDRPALRWTVYLTGGSEGLRFELYETFSPERADHFAQSVIDMLKAGFIPELQIPPIHNELTDSSPDVSATQPES